MCCLPSVHILTGVSIKITCFFHIYAGCWCLLNNTCSCKVEDSIPPGIHLKVKAMKQLATKEEKVKALNLLLVCGVFSSVLYIAMNIFIPLLYPGYDVYSQTVSELSALGAPTRQLWVVLGSIYGILVVFFGRGIYKAAEGNRKLKITGILIMVYAIVGLFWPPMHQRQVIAAGGATITDTLHIVFTFITIPLMLTSIMLAGFSFVKSFLLYSMITIVLLIVFGILTALDAPAMESNWPTPYMGIWERISIGAYVIWQIVLAVNLFYRVNRSEPFSQQGTTQKRSRQYSQGVE
jgi:hypothetical protein